MIPTIRFRFCCRCGWWLRAGWYAQELFHTFGEQLRVELEPGEGGEFRIWHGDALLWDRREQGWPDAKQLKQLVRDACFPDRELGHNER